MCILTAQTDSRRSLSKSLLQLLFFISSRKKYNRLFRVPIGHSGALTSIHCSRVPTGLSGDTHLDFTMKWMQSTVLECLPKAHEKIMVLRVYQSIKAFLVIENQKLKPRAPGCRNVWKSRNFSHGPLLEGPRRIWSVSKKSHSSLRWGVLHLLMLGSRVRRTKMKNLAKYELVLKKRSYFKIRKSFLLQSCSS